MPGPPFHPDDAANTIGPAEAFDPSHEANPSVYALQHHLVMEVVAHLESEGVPFQFRGGTALHAKLPERRRFSIDADLTTSDPATVQEALRRFTRRFPKSDVRLREPPEGLEVDGVRHILDFGHAETPDRETGVQILVEVVEGAQWKGLEPLRLQGDGFDWGVDVEAPTLEAFAGQKLAVLGPDTVGKAVGAGPEHPRSNQGVCKQVFDLRELLRLELVPERVAAAYEDAVAEANALHGTQHAVQDCLDDAAALMGHLKRPRTQDRGEPRRYGLWSGYTHSRRWVARQAREAWQPRDYRIAAGAITRLATTLADEAPGIHAAARLVVLEQVPEDILAALDEARADEAPWHSKDDFAADARLAWAWAPRELW